MRYGIPILMLTAVLTAGCANTQTKDGEGRTASSAERCNDQAHTGTRISRCRRTVNEPVRSVSGDAIRQGGSSTESGTTGRAGGGPPSR